MTQGAGRAGYAMGIALLRIAIAALAAGLAVYGILNAVAVARGMWFRKRTRRTVQIALQVAR